MKYSKYRTVRLTAYVHFWIGVNIIGLPLIHTHEVKQSRKELNS